MHVQGIDMKDYKESNKAAFDEGLAMGHYQADSMYRNMIKEQHKKHDAQMKFSRHCDDKKK